MADEQQPRDLTDPAPESDPELLSDATTEPTAGAETTTPAPTRTPVTQTLGRVLIVSLAVLFGIFAVFNAQPVDFSWVFGETEVVKQGDEVVSGGVPLIILLIVTFVVGLTIGRISTWRRTRALKREVKVQRKG